METGGGFAEPPCVEALCGAVQDESSEQRMGEEGELWFRKGVEPHSEPWVDRSDQSKECVISIHEFCPLFSELLACEQDVDLKTPNDLFYCQPIFLEDNQPSTYKQILINHFSDLKGETKNWLSFRRV